MSADLLTDVVDGVLTLTINRPRQRNAMTLDIAQEIGEALTELDHRDDLTVGILTGTGGCFCAGMDLKRFAQGERPYVPGLGFGGLTERTVAKPLIAAVEGWALGGGFELVLACDLVTAGETAGFGLPEVKRGLVARGGGMLRLPARLPRAIALELLMTGDPLPAPRAAQFGLVNRLVAEGSALEEAKVLAASITANAPLAVRTSKSVAVQAVTWPEGEAFERQLPEVDAVFSSHDAEEGALAFAEKRRPVWLGR